jgi:hypothetical protein
MLKKILSITGKPGLYKLISQGKNMIIVESLIDKKRTPSYAHEKVVGLGDIAIFTDNGEVSLGEVFEKIKNKEAGVVASVDPKSEPKILQKYFEEILPDFDKEKVFPSDIKKIVSWYNLLIKNEITDFVEKE